MIMNQSGDKENSEQLLLSVKGLRGPLWLGSISLMIIALILTVCFAVSLSIFLRLGDNQAFEELQSTERATPFESKKTRGFINCPEGNALMATDKESLHELIDLIVRKDDLKQRQLLKANRILSVECGTAVEIMEIGSDYVIAMPLTGRLAGRVIYAYPDWISYIE